MNYSLGTASTPVLSVFVYTKLASGIELFLCINHFISMFKGKCNTPGNVYKKKREGGGKKLAALIGSHMQQNLHGRGDGGSRRFNYEIANMQATWRWRPSLRLMRLMDG